MFLTYPLSRVPPQALNIPLLGASTSRAILKRFPSPQALLAAKTEDFLEISGIGPALATALPGELQRHLHMTLLPLAQYGVPCLQGLLENDTSTMISLSESNKGENGQVTGEASNATALNRTQIDQTRTISSMDSLHASSPISTSSSSRPSVPSLPGDVVITGTFAVAPHTLHSKALRAWMYAYIANKRQNIRAHGDAAVAAATGVPVPGTVTVIPETSACLPSTSDSADAQIAEVKLAQSRLVLFALHGEWGVIDAEQLLAAEAAALEHLVVVADAATLEEGIQRISEKWAGNGNSMSVASSVTPASLPVPARVPAKVSRDLLSSMATAMGLTMGTRVTSGTYALVVAGAEGSTARESSKIAKARSAKVEIKDEKWFLQCLGL